MSRARVARRIAAAAAYGGGGIGLLGGAAVGLLLTEARWARSTIGTCNEDPPVADGRYGAFLAGADPGAADGEPMTDTAGDPGGVPLRMAFLGDSTAAGFGVHRAGETPSALLASGLAAVAERPVELANVALSGATSEDLPRQTALLADRMPSPDVCVIMIGANDVTERMPPAVSVRHLAAAVSTLRATGAQVVVGTCPDLGTIEPVRQPLRWIARRLSRQLAAAQTIAVVGLGGRTVSLGQLLGPEFAARPREMFGPDSYHPSAAGYATAAMAVLPTLCASLGLWPDDARPAGALDAADTVTTMTVERAAAAAAAESGTEVVAAVHATGDAVPPATTPDSARRAPWALLRVRRGRGVATSPEGSLTAG
ncbi:SGNH/GDSL hydrolase family protein [Streptomyces sp. SL13]|uniref:SGNH/GDSL hydrolase family protein n=1 Tax=Streptantibioticus silvisoli TaxID=2705255 RepID=A0AA90HC36_9ACTN|nr:SGNH/GDSL hydrolase family protein [Streptantibioticus silvisoli]MDI5972965.1 SGNH/GDSL hydrolase family protein [Streptantibioticus silvisoli]